MTIGRERHCYARDWYVRVSRDVVGDCRMSLAMRECQETSFLHAREVSQDSHIIQELLWRGRTMSLDLETLARGR